MIRTSAAIGTVAVILSLLVHITGLNFAFVPEQEQTDQTAGADAIEMGSRFEDVAESVIEPVAPESADVPEPPIQLPPEPDAAEVPTSDAQIASENPQQTLSPGTGERVAPQSPPAIGETPAEVSVTQPAEPVSAAEPPEIDQKESRDPVDTAAAEQTQEPPSAVAAQQPQKQQLAAIQPFEPVVPIPTPSAIPVAPVEPEETKAPLAVGIAPAPNIPDADAFDEKVEGTELAVVTSPRPKVPSSSAISEPSDSIDGPQDTNELGVPTSQRIESPLTVYKRDGVDLFGGQISSSSRRSFLQSRGPGNASTTNYAGRILSHLNGFPSVRVSARGAARVFFEINPDGTLAWVDIVDGTGSEEVDRAAKAQVRAAAPFPPPPDGKSQRFAFVYRTAP